MDGPRPELSIVVPAHDEATLVRESVEGVCTRLRALDLSFELIVAENGSRDATVAIVQEIAAARDEVHFLSYPEPNYGAALREGIYRARGEYVVCDEVDLCDVDFHLRALELLRQRKADMVVGSKAMDGASDRRPPARQLATRAYNRLLRVAVGFRGTDTHGLKAFRRSVATPVVAQCVTEHDVFASELVIRCERAGLVVLEIPVAIEEKREPSIHLWRRVPRVVTNLGRLMVALSARSAPSTPVPSDPRKGRED